MLKLFSNLDVVRLSDDREHYIVKFPPDDGRKEQLKQAAPSAKWDSDAQGYYVPSTWTQTVRLIVHGFFKFAQEAKEHARQVRLIESDRAAASAASDADLDLRGFGVTPFPFQRAGIKYALDRKRVIIGDQMGLGKTIQGLGTVYLANAFPCIVVTPASLKYNWAESEIPRAFPGKFVVIADKDTPLMLLQLAKVIVTNYEQLVGFRSYKSVDGLKRTCWKDATKREVLLSPLAKKLRDLGAKSIICDEAHYLKDPATGRTMATMAIRHSCTYRLLLTGTAMLNRPAELWSLMKFLDRGDEFGGYIAFMERFCGMRKGKYGVEAKSAFHAAELNRRMRASFYIRRLKKDVLKELPPKLRTNYKIDIDNREEYVKAEKELLEWVKDRVHQDKAFMESIAHLPEMMRIAAIHERQTDKAERAKKAEVVVRISALKNVAARGKLAAAKQWIDDFLESGEKLVVFATNKEILSALITKYPKAARIISEDDDRERQVNVKKFQSDNGPQLIICAMGTSATNSPGGVGHTLTAASNVLFLQLGWNPALHDQCEDRCHRIGQEDNVTAHYLLGRDTIEIPIAELIEEKRAICQQVLDGGPADDQEHGILSELMERLARVEDIYSELISSRPGEVQDAADPVVCC